jgi:hypothetical protein
MSQVKTFKLIVQVNEVCLEILRYLDKNISTINRLGVRIQVEKLSKSELDEEMLETLRKKGITRLPVLIVNDGKLLVGLKRIIDMFEKNLNNARVDERVSPAGDYGGPAVGAEMGTNPDLCDYWQRELYAGTDRKGKMIPRDDKDEGEDEGGDIERRLADYRRNEPKHRRSGGGRERDIDPPPRERPRRGGHRVEEPEDNIADSDDDSDGGYDEPPPKRGGGSRAPRLPPTGDAGGDAMDQRMLAAWMDNNPQD